MRRSLLLSFHSASAKYFRLKKKIQKSISRGEFWRFTRRKRNHLLRKAENLRQRLSQLSIQLRIAAVGAGMSLLMMATDASAQSTSTSPIGPFVRNQVKNPLPPPAFDRLNYSRFTFVDLDRDGDLDVVQTFEEPSFIYYVNVGTHQKPVYEKFAGDPFQEAREEIFEAEYNQNRTSFADIDDDGDMDMVVGQEFTDYSSSQPDHIFFFRGAYDADLNNPRFVVDGEHDPFRDIEIEGDAYPIFADIDKDGDQDLVVVGRYYDEDAATDAMVQVYRNDKVGHAPDVDPTFTQLIGEANPLYVTFTETKIVPSFADIDEDGDLDMAYTLSYENGRIFYKRNDNGEFRESNQNDDWVYNAENPGASTGNPFKNINVFAANDYRSVSFADIDGDGDQDMTIGIIQSYANPDSRNYIFIENLGKGNFVQPGPLTFAGPLTGVDLGAYSGLTTGDFDNDGDLDLISSSLVELGSGDCDAYGCSNYTVTARNAFIQNNNGKFEFQFNNPLGTVIGESGHNGRIAVADVDGDGDFDAVITYYDLPTEYYRNDDGILNEQFAEDNPFDELSFINEYAVDFGDFNNDGRVDMLLAEGSRNPRLYENTGEVGTTPEYVHAELWETGFNRTPFDSTFPKIVDLDSDGDLDFVLGKYNNMWYYENTGTPTEPAFKLYVDKSFTGAGPEDLGNPFTDIDLGSGSTQPVPSLVDVDDDGDKDMLFGLPDGTFVLFENQNPAPTVAIEDTAIPYVEGEFIELAPDAVLTDIDADRIVKIEVRLNDFVQGVDRLHLGDGVPGLDDSWDDDAGVLTITGTTSLSDWENAIRLLLFQAETQDNLKAGRSSKRSSAGRSFNKTISITVLDSDLTVDDGNQITITLFHNNEVPELTPTTFTAVYNSVPFNIIPTVNVADDDDEDLVSAEIRFDAATYQPGEDRLIMNLTGFIGPSFNPSTGVLTLTGPGTKQQYQNALQAVMYENTNPGGPTGTTRTLHITVNDGEHDSNIGVLTMSMTAVSAAPALATPNNDKQYLSPSVVINNDFTITDSDNTDIQSATVGITNNFITAEDRLLFTNTAKITGSYSTSTGVLSLTGAATLAEYEAALESVAYQNITTIPTGLTRTISFSVSDGSNTSNTRNVAVFFVNNPPLLAPATATASYNNTPLAINPSIAITDDNGTIISAVVAITNGYISGEDQLQFTNQNGITGVFNATTGVLTLTGTATAAQYTTALASVQYNNTATVKTSALRTVSFKVNDGAGDSNNSVVQISVANTAPTISGTATGFYNNGEAVVNNAIQLNDVDNTVLQGATVAITNGFNMSEDRLVFVDQNGISGAYANNTGILTLTGVSSVVNYQTALRSVRYRNVSSTPSTVNRGFTFSITDGGSPVVLTGTTIVINKPPVINAPNRQTAAGGNIVLVISSLVSDPDNNLDLTTLAVTSREGARIIEGSEFVTIDYSSVPDYEGFDEISVTICDSGGQCAATTFTVEVGADAVIYTGMSPNGDGVNDWFHIQFLPAGTQVSFYNRWGDSVFETNDYDENDPSKRFEGKNKNGTDLVAGSYFYKVRFPDGRTKTGYVLLNR